MEPLIILTTTTAALLAAGAIGPSALRPLRAWHLALRGGLAVMFLFTGLAHFDAFGMRAELVAMVPSALPAPGLLVTLTGFLELAGALGILLPAVWPWAAVGLSLLLVAMFPANVYKAFEDSTLGVSQELLPRTALQALFLSATLVLVWRYWTVRRMKRA